ncbi:MAG: FkbM family methyltransferase [Flavobacteriaceae bacterium]
MIKKIVIYALSWFGIKAKEVENKNEFRSFIRTRRKYKKFKPYKLHDLKIGDLNIITSNVGSAIQVYEDVFVNETHKVTFNNTKPLIYDLGAHIGMVSLYYKQKYPQAIIKAFEPNPVVFKCLQQNMISSKLQNVSVFNQAISYENGSLDFYCDKGGQVSSFIKPGDFETETQKIESVRLKDLIDKESRQIDLIKMDIEGVELEVLIDCDTSLQKVDRLVVEYHSYKKNNQKLSQFFSVLEKNGFRYMIKPNSSADFDLHNLNYNKSHFDMIIHIEAIQKNLLSTIQ